MGVLIAVAVALLTVIPMWRIAERGGKAGAWSLLAAIPLVGPFAYWLVLATGDWPHGRGGRDA